MKICPNCGTGHNNSRSKFCGRKIVNNCLHCGAPKETKCRSDMKVYCSQKCSTKHKRNKCLNCGDPCKEKYCKKDIKINCKYCGKEHTAKCGKQIAKYCSGVCAAKDPEIKEKAKQTQYNNHGGVLAFNTPKQKETMIRKYGFETPAKNKKVKEKAKQTQFKNNDGMYSFNTPKQKETMIKKYGSHGILGNEKKLEQHYKKMKERYGVSHPSQNKEFLEKSINSIIERHGRLFGSGVVSKINLKIASLIESELNVEVEFEKQLSGSFIDLYLPEYSIGVEINPTITHNFTVPFICKRMKCESQPCHKHEKFPKDYHFKKSNLAMENNVDLIQFFEWQTENELIETIKRKIEKKELFEINIISKGKIEKELILEVDKDNQRILTKEDNKLKELNYTTIEEYLNKEFHDREDVSVISQVDFNSNSNKEIYLNSIGFKELKMTGPKLILHKKKKEKVIVEEFSEEHSSLLSSGYLEVYTSGSREFVLSNGK